MQRDDLKELSRNQTISEIPAVQEAIASTMLTFWDRVSRKAVTPSQQQNRVTHLKGLAESLQQSYEALSGGRLANARGV